MVISPKSKRYDKHQRTIPLFPRLETKLAEHFELTGLKSKYVIEQAALRSQDANLRTTFTASVSGQKCRFSQTRSGSFDCRRPMMFAVVDFP
ncbi:MAG: hypothetical protein ACON5D_19645 [Rubripirellula sp.]